MKKLLLSIFVIGGFALYAIFHNQANSAPALPVNTTSNSNTNSDPTPTSAFSSSQALPTDTPAPTQGVTTSSGQFKNGEYTGSAIDAFYGLIQVKAVVQNGKLADVQFLQYPNDRRESIEINSQALPMLKQEAIQAQSAQVDIISGATDSSQAFVQSLSSALSQAKS